MPDTLTISFYRKEAIMRQFQAGTEVNTGERGYRYERHRPEQTLLLLYQLVEEYYPTFVAQLATQARNCLNVSGGNSRAI